MESAEQNAVPETRNKKWLWISLAILLALVALGLLWWWQQKMIATVGDCTLQDLSLSIGQKDGTAGTMYVHAVVANTSNHACKVQGHPTAFLLDADGKAVRGGVAAASDSADPGSTITLQQSDKAHAILAVPNATNFEATACSAESKFLGMYMPGVVLSLANIRTPFVQKACTGFTISVFTAGA